MRGKKPVSESKPPVLGLPPAIQKMSPKQASACAAESALVALESLTNSTRALAADLLHAVGEPGERAQPALDLLGRHAERERGAAGAGGVLRIVHAAQRADAAELRDAARGAARRQHDLPGLDIEPVGERARAPRRAARACLRARCGRPTAWHQLSSTPTMAVPSAARRRPAAPSPRRNAQACHGGRDGPR